MICGMAGDAENQTEVIVLAQSDASTPEYSNAKEEAALADSKEAWVDSRLVAISMSERYEASKSAATQN